MKKFYLLILILIIFLNVSPKVLAEDKELNEYTNSVENAFNGQKPITDEEFDKMVEKLRDKKYKKQRTPFKGQSVNKDQDDNGIFDNENILLSLPVTLLTKDGTEIPVGHYKVTCEKKNDSVYFNFYQGYNLIAKVDAKETDNDFKEPSINFCKLVPYDEQYVKIIYGSLEFNAYAFIPVKDGIEGQ